MAIKMILLRIKKIKFQLQTVYQVLAKLCIT